MFGKHIHTLTTTTLGTGTVVDLVNGISQGYTEFTRIGDVVSMYHVRTAISAYPTTVDQSNAQLRLMLVYDKQTNGVAPSMYSALNTGVLEIAIIAISPINDLNQYRFEVLQDKTYCMNGSFDKGGGGQTQIFDIWETPLNHTTVFTGSGGRNQDVKTGGLYLMAFSTSTTKIDVSTSVHFEDA